MCVCDTCVCLYICAFNCTNITVVLTRINIDTHTDINTKSLVDTHSHNYAMPNIFFFKEIMLVENRSEGP